MFGWSRDNSFIYSSIHSFIIHIFNKCIDYFPCASVYIRPQRSKEEKRHRLCWFGTCTAMILETDSESKPFTDSYAEGCESKFRALLCAHKSPHLVWCFRKMAISESDINRVSRKKSGEGERVSQGRRNGTEEKTQHGWIPDLTRFLYLEV